MGAADSMRDSLARLLVCPACGGALVAAAGDLVCGGGHRYPVRNGIPRLVVTECVSASQDRTAAAFGYAWTHHPPGNPYTEEQWRDWVLPLKPAAFERKLVLDAGCGLAGFAEYALEDGARQVVGIDFSQAVDMARDRLGDRVDLVQGDLERPPFRPGSFDIVYSIGVLHHLPEPERGFQAIAKLARPGGLVFAWVYGRENNGWIVYLVSPLRRAVLSRLPRGLLKWGVALPLALILWPFTKLARTTKRLPYGEYLAWLGGRDLVFVHSVVFDHLVAPTSHYIRREEFEAWFERAGLTDVLITHRNGNSWRGLGRVLEVR